MYHDDANKNYIRMHARCYKPVSVSAVNCSPQFKRVFSLISFLFLFFFFFLGGGGAGGGGDRGWGARLKAIGAAILDFKSRGRLGRVQRATKDPLRFCKSNMAAVN